MDPYEYQPIDLSTNAIRLLRLRAGTPADSIHCDVFQSVLGDKDGIPYEALSYTWGDVSDLAKISLDGHTAWITRNLHLALTHIRQVDSDRILWVDAICINQAVQKERTHQVGQMGLIYQNAENVLIWLGGIDDGMDSLMKLMAVIEKRALQSKMGRNHYMDTCRLVWSFLIDELGGTQTKSFLKQQKALQELLDRTWFRRVWILQEVIFARRADVVCGSSSVSSPTFAIMPFLMGVTPNSHASAILDLMPHKPRNKAQKPSLDLWTLLSTFRSSEASDPRDKIYALLGISSDAFDSEKFPADYTLDEREVVQRTISFILFKEISDFSSSSFPTWTLENLFSYADNIKALILKVFHCAVIASDIPLAMRIIDLPEFLINGDGRPDRFPLLMVEDNGGPDIIRQRLLTHDGLKLKFPGKPFGDVGKRALNAAIEQLFGILRGAQNTDDTASQQLSQFREVAMQGNPAAQALSTSSVMALDPILNEYKNRPFKEEVIRIVLDQRAKIEHRNDRFAESTVGMELMRQSPGVTSLLRKISIEEGTEIESLDATLFENSIRRGDWGVVKLLLVNGANLFATYSDGETLLSREETPSQFFLSLLEIGFPIDLVNRRGQTPLHTAISRRRLFVVETLLREGASMNTKDGTGLMQLLETPEVENDEMYRLLRSYGATSN